VKPTNYSNCSGNPDAEGWGVLGASGYIYCEAHRSTNLPNWVSAHIHMFEFYGSVPKIVRPDNLKAGVTEPRFCAPLLRPASAPLT
jgi:transposase